MDGLDSALAYTHRSIAKHQLTHTLTQGILPPTDGSVLSKELRTTGVLTRLKHLLPFNGVCEDYMLLQLGQRFTLAKGEAVSCMIPS